MRADLARLRGKRVRIAGTFERVSPQGHVLLRNVETCAGNLSHLWIRFPEWRMPLPFPDERVRFEATICPYQRSSDNSVDYGPEDLREVRE
jgi:hypothetical protein